MSGFERSALPWQRFAFQFYSMHGAELWTNSKVELNMLTAKFYILSKVSLFDEAPHLSLLL